jgi:hypothetical protein
MTGVEVIYPIVPLHLVDRVISQTDSVLYRRLLLTADKVRDIVRFRVRDVNFDAFLTFIESHLVVLAELNMPSTYPFGMNFYRSDVRIISYSGHVRELERFFRIDVTFEFHTGIT